MLSQDRKPRNLTEKTVISFILSKALYALAKNVCYTLAVGFKTHIVMRMIWTNNNSTSKQILKRCYTLTAQLVIAHLGWSRPSYFEPKI